MSQVLTQRSEAAGRSAAKHDTKTAAVQRQLDATTAAMRALQASTDFRVASALVWPSPRKW